jgi:acyl carrier protein
MRARIVEEFTSAAVARAIGMGAGARPDPDVGFFDLGLDSLGAVELRKHLEVELGVELPASVVFDHSTVDRLARHLLELCAPRAPDAEAAPALHAVLAEVRAFVAEDAERAADA